MKNFILFLFIQLYLYSFVSSQSQQIMSQDNSSKELVLSFYKEVVGNRQIDLLDNYIHKDYIQHSPMIKDGREGLREALAFLQQMPEPKEKKSPILFALEDGQIVFLFLQLEMMGKKLAIMELFRVEENKIIEHWDATEEIEAFFDPIPELSSVQDQTDKNKQIIRSAFPQNQLLKRILALGDFVITQAGGELEGKAYVFYELSRLSKGKVVQKWQLKQAVPEKMMHANGML